MDDEFDLVPDPGREAIIMVSMLIGALRTVPGMAEGIRQAAVQLEASSGDDADLARAARRVIRIMDAPIE
jgi:hypothetical protein